MRILRRKLKSRHGFTMLETMLTIAVLAIVMLSVMGILMPAFRLFFVYSDKETDNSFMINARERITEKIRYSEDLQIININASAPPGTGWTIITPNAQGFFDIDEYFSRENAFFRERVQIRDTGEYFYAAPPVLPKRHTNLAIFIEAIDGEAHTVAVTIRLERSGVTVGESVFPVKAIIMEDIGRSITISETRQGRQAFAFK
jgi:prepilin-type N-terminal cleavage/methylation domain-containing protein